MYSSSQNNQYLKFLWCIFFSLLCATSAWYKWHTGTYVFPFQLGVFVWRIYYQIVCRTEIVSDWGLVFPSSNIVYVNQNLQHVQAWRHKANVANKKFEYCFALDIYGFLCIFDVIWSSYSFDFQYICLLSCYRKHLAFSLIFKLPV